MRLFAPMLVISLCATPAAAGRLDQLEQDARAKRRSEPTDSEHEESDDSDTSQCRCDDCQDKNCSDDDDSVIATLAFLVIAYGGYASAGREMAGSRLAGEALIPRARLDATGQKLGENIEALQVAGELGWGPVAVRIEGSHLEESKPADTLELLNLSALYRMSFGDAVEMDLQFGATVLDGNESATAFAFGIPVRIHPSDYFGFEFRALWSFFDGSAIQDYDARLLVGWRFASVVVGYRWLRSENVRFGGPIAGVAVRW